MNLEDEHKLIKRTLKCEQQIIQANQAQDYQKAHQLQDPFNLSLLALLQCRQRLVRSKQPTATTVTLFTHSQDTFHDGSHNMIQIDHPDFAVALMPRPMSTTLYKLSHHLPSLSALDVLNTIGIPNFLEQETDETFENRSANEFFAATSRSTISNTRGQITRAAHYAKLALDILQQRLPTLQTRFDIEEIQPGIFQANDRLTGMKQTVVPRNLTNHPLLVDRINFLSGLTVIRQNC